MSVTWDSKVAAVAGKEADKVEKALGVRTVGDLLQTYPRSYVAKGSLSDLGELDEGDFISIFGQVTSCVTKTYEDRRTRRTAYRTLVDVRGSDGSLALTFFDKQFHTAEWRKGEYALGRYGLFSGKLKWFNGHWELNNPRAKMYAAEGEASEAYDAIPDLIPIYRASGNVDTWQIEESVKLALDLVDHVPDVLGEDLRTAEELLDARTALTWVHRPSDHSQLGAARKRLKLDEAYVTQVVLAQRRAELSARTTKPRPGRDGGILDRFDARLPFTLTDGQRSVSDTLLEDLAGGHPMHRLLQGEVGSGKTVVALRAMLRVVDSGGQAVLLAPTEVLAQQHDRSIRLMLGDLAEAGQLGGTVSTRDGGDGTRVALLTGSQPTAVRRQAMLDVVSGDAGIVVGTHALLEDKVEFFDLGLVVVDEQHRFGVEQRAALTSKAEQPPHVLVMTATPIPRTVAMTVFGDLETSVLSELPQGRADVQTNVVPALQQAWVDRAWERIREEVAAGRQAYVVCSRIDISDSDDDSGLASVEETFEELSSGPLSGLRVAKLHGRMAPDDKDAVMRSFAAGDVDVLVATTVIEVGVDVPNASVMVILDADRFGVSQLHQLRGRIGRGGHPGLCLLVTEAKPGSPSLDRLQAVAATRDGFELSEVDLRQRREGDVLGTSQSGRRSTLRLLSVLDDVDVIDHARTLATQVVTDDPGLSRHPDLREAVHRLEESEAADYLDMS
ncbi:MAG: ATP-dependent helicase RecG [Nocardioidaceae bacterium]|nr:ATP-dependent helicase RecG [Nocardioidaceae bacterium]